MATTKKATVRRKKQSLPGGATASDMKKIMDHALYLQAQRNWSKSRSMKEAWRLFKAGELSGKMDYGHHRSDSSGRKAG